MCISSLPAHECLHVYRMYTCTFCAGSSSCSRWSGCWATLPVMHTVLSHFPRQTPHPVVAQLLDQKGSCRGTFFFFLHVIWTHSTIIINISGIMQCCAKVVSQPLLLYTLPGKLGTGAVIHFVKYMYKHKWMNHVWTFMFVYKSKTEFLQF